MNLPIEVCIIIFSFLTPNDIIEVSPTCKQFYFTTRKNAFFPNKLRQEHCVGTKHLCMNITMMHYCFLYQLSVSLEKCVQKENLHRVNKVLLTQLYCIIEFSCFVSGIIFLCVRGLSLILICVDSVQNCMFERKRYQTT